MMTCDICHDTTGPFEVTEYKNRLVLACENCVKKYNKKDKAKMKRQDKRKKYYYRTL